MCVFLVTLVTSPIYGHSIWLQILLHYWLHIFKLVTSGCLPNRFWLLWAKTALQSRAFAPNQREEKKPFLVSLRGDSPLGVALAPQKVTKGLTLSQIQASREKSKLKGKVVKITIYISGECQKGSLKGSKRLAPSFLLLAGFKFSIFGFIGFSIAVIKPINKSRKLVVFCFFIIVFIF